MGWTNRTLVTDSDRYLRAYDRGQVILLRNIPPGAKDAELHNLVSKLGISTATFWWPYASSRHSCHIQAGHKEKAAIIMAGLNQVQLRGQTLYTEAVPVPRKRRGSAMTTRPATTTNTTAPAQVTTPTVTTPSSSAAVSNPVPSLDGITAPLADANLNSQSPAPAQVTGSVGPTVYNPVPTLEGITAPLADANLNSQNLAPTGGGNAVIQASASSASASAPGRQISLLDGLDRPLPWKPGKVLGKRANAHLDASMSEVFKPTIELLDQRSTTFFGYTPQYRRAEGRELSWGDYDRFLEWPLHGHHIPKDQVRKDGWETNRTAPIRSVSEDDHKDIFEVTAQLPEQDEPNEALKDSSRTLWETLNGGNSEHLDSRSSEAAETSKQKRVL